MVSWGLWDIKVHFLPKNRQFSAILAKNFGQFWILYEANFPEFWPNLAKKPIFSEIFWKSVLRYQWPNRSWEFGIRTTKPRKVISSAGYPSKNSNDIAFGCPWQKWVLGRFSDHRTLRIFGTWKSSRVSKTFIFFSKKSKRVCSKTKTWAHLYLMHLRKRFHSESFFICILMQLSVLHLPNYHSGSLLFSAVTLKGKTPNSKTCLFLLPTSVWCFWTLLQTFLDKIVFKQALISNFLN